MLTVCEPIRHHDPTDDGQLLQGDKGATNFRRGQLSIVQWYNHGKRADADTGNEPTSENVVVGSTMSECLDDHADREDTTGDHDAKFPTWSGK